MALELETVIPVGRRLIEYQGMFNLSKEELTEYKVIDCGGGPSSFNAEASALGAQVISIDPLYGFTQNQIQGRIDETFDPMMHQVKENQAMFVWKHIENYEALYAYRKEAMSMFIKDYKQGLSEKRYQYQSLPRVDIASKTFDLALCSHFLFLYSKQLTYSFHYDSIKEMLRLANEVRIFPLIDLEGCVSVHLEPLMQALGEEGYKTEVLLARYEFLKGAHAYLSIRQG